MSAPRDLLDRYHRRRARWVRVLWLDFGLRLTVIGWRAAQLVALMALLWR